MDLRDDERAQTVQVGAILLLGTLVVALSVYQVTSVPGQNSGTEFTHNQRVHEQLQEVRNAILDAAATGRSQSATIRLGTQYRDRIVAVNPAPPSGTLRTRALPGESTIRIDNARTIEGATGCWDGTDRALTTKGLVYRPDYNEYRDAPTTVYENSVLYDRFEREDNDRFLNRTGQRLVSARQLSLVALSGSYAESRSGTVSADVRPTSSTTEAITVTNSTDEPLTLAVSTTLPEETWRGLLEDELTENGGYVTNWTVENGSLMIELKRGVSYDLSLSQVTLGSASRTDGIHCLTGVSGNDSVISEGTSQELVFEVHDQYNAPVSDEVVSLALDGPGNLSDTSVRTDDQGRVTVTYTAPSNVDGPDAPVTVRATSDDSQDLTDPEFDRSDRENVAYDLVARNDDGSLAAIRWDRTAIGNQPGMTCTNDSCTYDPASDDDGAFEVFAVGEPPAVTNVTFTSSDETVASYERRDDATNQRGRATATVVAGDTGGATLTVSGGGRRARLPITVLNRDPTAAFEASPTAPETGGRVTFDARNSSDPDGDTLTYEWDFGDGNTTTTSLPTTDHVYGDDGTYDVTLTVVDEHGGRNATTETVTVSNRAPNAAIEYGPQAPLTDQTVTFDGSGSTDPDGEIDRYEWDLDGDGTFETAGERVERSYADDGDREVRLRVTDDDGTTHTTTTTVTVRNRKPTANFYYTPRSPQEGEPVTFDAGASEDSDGSIDSYEWMFYRDGNLVREESSERFTVESVPAGTYEVVLTVTDDDGDTNDYTDTLVVEDAEPQVLLDYSEDFEDGAPGWGHYRFESSARAGRSQATSNSGSTSVYHRSGAGAVVSPRLDTSGASEIEIEYWIRKGADSFSENPDANTGEDFIVEYRNANGNWVEIDRIEDTVEPGAQFTRRETVSAPAAAHDGFRIRFRQEGASSSDGDVWHFDDVTVTARD